MVEDNLHRRVGCSAEFAVSSDTRISQPFTLSYPGPEISPAFAATLSGAPSAISIEQSVSKAAIQSERAGMREAVLFQFVRGQFF
jgi:hypothetical protein